MAPPKQDADTRAFMDRVSDKPAAQVVKRVAKDLIKGKRLVSSVVRRSLEHEVAELVKEGAGPFPMVSLFQSLNHHYGDAWPTWAPETLWKTMPMPEGEVDAIKNAVQALQVVATTNAPFEDWHIFEKVGHAFCLEPVNFGQIEPLEPDHAAYAVYVLQQLRPQLEFESEVKGYVAACAKRAGLVYLPTELFPEGCQALLDGLGNDLELRDQIAAVWPRIVNDDSALGVQGARLTEIQTFVDRRRA